MMNIERLITERKGTIVDVRSVDEYRSGHVEGSINIPLPELMLRKDELSSYAKPLLMCCASGGRSGVAQQQLQSIGLESYNVGSWLDVNFLLAQIEH